MRKPLTKQEVQTFLDERKTYLAWEFELYIHMHVKAQRNLVDVRLMAHTVTEIQAAENYLLHLENKTTPLCTETLSEPSS